MPRIDHGDDAVESEFLAHSFIDEESLRHRSRIGEAGGLEYDAVEFIAAGDQISQDTDQIAANGAADAPIVHLEDLFLGIDHQFLIDADVAELILDHGDALAMAFGEDAVEQRRLARAQESGQYSYGNSIRFSHDASYAPPAARALMIQPNERGV